MNFKKTYQKGVSIGGLVATLVILGFIGLLAAKIVPAYTEFASIKKSIEVARTAGSVRDIQTSFDKQKLVTGVEAISGADLEISKNGEQTDIAFAYQKKIPLFGKVSLLIDFAGSTSGAQ